MRRGDRFPHPTDLSGNADPATFPRVMGVIDGYVMARRPGCGPFVISEKEAVRLAASLPHNRPDDRPEQEERDDGEI